MSFDLHNVLNVAVKSGASDVHFKVGLPPMFRVNGALRPLPDLKTMSEFHT
jgi:twitching motility protein PilT